MGQGLFSLTFLVLLFACIPGVAPSDHGAFAFTVVCDFGEALLQKKSVNWAIEWLQNASFVRGSKACPKHLCLPGLMVPFLLPLISTETLLSVSSIECSNHSHYHLGVCILGAWIKWVSPMTLELCLFCHYTFCLVLAFRKLRHGSMLRGSISLTLGFWNYPSFSAFCLFPYSS